MAHYPCQLSAAALLLTRRLISPQVHTAHAHARTHTHTLPNSPTRGGNITGTYRRPPQPHLALLQRALIGLQGPPADAVTVTVKHAPDLALEVVDIALGGGVLNLERVGAGEEGGVVVVHFCGGGGGGGGMVGHCGGGGWHLRSEGEVGVGRWEVYVYWWWWWGWGISSVAVLLV